LKPTSPTRPWSAAPSTRGASCCRATARSTRSGASRTSLSRDRALNEEWRISDIHQIESEKVRDQLIEVVHAFELAPEIQLLSRCSHCNAALEPAALGDVNERVPPRVLERHDVFSACPRCGRVYWEGTHTERIKRFVDELLAETRTPGPT
jgi:uncharacterized protein with PIN domain